MSQLVVTSSADRLKLGSSSLEQSPEQIQRITKIWLQVDRPQRSIKEQLQADRLRSILAREAMACVVRDGPYTEDKWFRSVPALLRTQMEGYERQFLLDERFKSVMEST